MSEYDPELIGHLREEFGATAEDEIARVVEMSRRLADRWGVRLEGWLPGGTCSLVLTGRREGAEVVLRSPLLPWELPVSLPTLLAFSGRGGIRVLRFDQETGMTLLPRLRPGTALDTAAEEEAIEVLASLIPRLRSAGDDVPNAPSVVTSLTALLAGRRQRAAEGLRTDPIRLARRLLDSSPPPRLLHGDLHHFNVLRDGAEWVAIDPEGVSGDPAYECAAFLRNPIPRIGDEPRLPDILRHRVLRLADRLNLPADRIWGWALVRTTQSVVVPDQDPPHPWTRVLAALDALSGEFGGTP